MKKLALFCLGLFVGLTFYYTLLKPKPPAYYPEKEKMDVQREQQYLNHVVDKLPAELQQEIRSPDPIDPEGLHIPDVHPGWMKPREPDYVSEEDEEVETPRYVTIDGVRYRATIQPDGELKLKRWR